MKSVLITGCSKGGIGDALAQEFHSKGIRVFATARDLSKVEHLKNLGLNILQLDVTSADSIAKVAGEVEKATGGKLDFLVNNAGIGYTMPLLDTNIDAARKIFEANVFSVLAVTQAFARSLIAAKGKVVNMGSIVGRIAQAYTGVYNTSKAATNLLSETLRLELTPFGVEVITVITGTVNSGFFANQGSNVNLPEGSLYLPLQQDINDAANGKDVLDGAWEPTALAQGIVANALKPKSKLWFWLGGKTWLVWFVTTFMPHTFPDGLFLKSSGLGKLQGIIAGSAGEGGKS